MKNLDAVAVRTAHGIIDDTKAVNGEKLDAGKVDNLITKALGVLQENGVYAAILYLYSRTEKNDKFIAEKAREKPLSLV
jgi:CRISPR/Cas system CMR-associated protein Cmr5 small subunit